MMAHSPAVTETSGAQRALSTKLGGLGVNATKTSPDAEGL